MTEGTAAVHVHAFTMPLGLVREGRVARSPVSTLDDVLWDEVIAVQSCACGQLRRTVVGQERQRSRFQDERAGSR